MAACMVVATMANKRQSDMKRAIRLLVLMDLLAQRRWTALELAASCGVHVSTVYKDLTDLQGEGVRLPLMEEDHRYWIERSRTKAPA